MPVGATFSQTTGTRLILSGYSHDKRCSLDVRLMWLRRTSIKGAEARAEKPHVHDNGDHRHEAQKVTAPVQDRHRPKNALRSLQVCVGNGSADVTISSGFQVCRQRVMIGNAQGGRTMCPCDSPA